MDGSSFQHKFSPSSQLNSNLPSIILYKSIKLSFVHKLNNTSRNNSNITLKVSKYSELKHDYALFIIKNNIIFSSIMQVEIFLLLKILIKLTLIIINFVMHLLITIININVIIIMIF